MENLSTRAGAGIPSASPTTTTPSGSALFGSEDSDGQARFTGRRRLDYGLGGRQARFYKLILGALTLAFLSNGLTISRVDSAYSELIQGVILLGVVFFSNFIQKQFTKHQMAAAARASVA